MYFYMCVCVSALSWKNILVIQKTVEILSKTITTPEAQILPQAPLED